MRIAVIGRGNVGGGLADRWERTGHNVDRFGRDGGDASAAEVILVAIPPLEIDNALSNVAGITGKITIDATNAFQGRMEGFPSLAHQIKSIVEGPTSKSFNYNYASLYNDIDKESVPPSNLFASDDEARSVTEQLIRDAGYDPVYLGGLDQARPLEDMCTGLGAAIAQGGLGAHFYRFAKPGDLGN